MRRFLGVPLAVALLSTACSSGTPSATPDTGSAATGSAAQSSDENETPTAYEGPFELEFTATLIGGDPFDGTSVAGRDVLLWFWAPS